MFKTMLFVMTVFNPYLQLFINEYMLCRADMADQLAKVKDDLEIKAQQDETDLKAKKSALLDIMKKYVCVLRYLLHPLHQLSDATRMVLVKVNS